MFKNILVPLDRSRLAERALGVAAALARASGASIDVAIVHRPLPFDGIVESPWSATEWTNESEYVEAISAELALAASTPVTHAVLNGEPVEMICRRAQYNNVDLVVMASHRRTGMSRAWFGSVADGVISRSATPVLLVPGDHGEVAPAGSPPIDRILVPLDGSELAAESLGPAAALAQCFGATLILITVVEPALTTVADMVAPFAIMPIYADEQMTQRLVTNATDDLEVQARRLRDRGFTVETHVVVGANTGKAIVTAARSHRARVIAMSTHGRGLSRLLIGSVADAVEKATEVCMLIHRPKVVHLAPDLNVSESELQTR